MSARDALRDVSSNGKRAPGAYEVMFDAKGKLLLPEVPAHDDPAGCCAWLTTVFNLAAAHPVTRGERQGAAGPDGHVALHRAGAPTIRFEPAAKINTPAKLIEALSWQTLPIDGAIHALKADHCREIAYVTRMLCGRSELLAAEQEAAGVVGETTPSVAKPWRNSLAPGPEGINPRPALRPKSPQHAAGMRIEPPPSLAPATGKIPAATAAAAPPLEPPGCDRDATGCGPDRTAQPQ